MAVISPDDGVHIAARRAVLASDDVRIVFTGRDVRELGPRRPLVDVYVIDSEAILHADEVKDRIPSNQPILFIHDEPVSDGLGIDDVENLLVPAVQLMYAGYEVGRDSGVDSWETGEEDLNTLTDREHDVLVILATGGANRQIADELGISENTVKYHLQEIYRKLNVNSRSAAVMEAIRKGILVV